MLLSALKSCGRDDLAAYVKARHEISRRDFIQKTQGTLHVYLIPFIAIQLLELLQVSAILSGSTLVAMSESNVCYYGVGQYGV